MTPRRLNIVAALLVILCAGPARSQDPPDPELEQAVAALRGIDPAKLTEAQRKKKSAEIDKAWTTLRSRGLRGLERLRQECQSIDRAGQRDDSSS